MQETILDGKAKGQETAYGYTKEVNDNAKPRTEKKLSERQKEVEGKTRKRISIFYFKIFYGSYLFLSHTCQLYISLGPFI